jgi:hypothetical protein
VSVYLSQNSVTVDAVGTEQSSEYSLHSVLYSNAVATVARYGTRKLGDS